jgi:hypothetical protein
MSRNASIVENAALEWFEVQGDAVGHRPRLAHCESAAMRRRSIAGLGKSICMFGEDSDPTAEEMVATS